MFETAVIFCFASIFYAYIGYPLLLLVFNIFVVRKNIEQKEVIPLSVSIIIAARNEAPVIQKKLENTLALMRAGGEPIQIIVASDASDDGTNEIVQNFAARGVELVSTARRGGKESAQQAALEIATGEVIIFTDAKVQLETDAVDKFLAYFLNEKIGAVSSTDKIKGGGGEGLYVRYEMWLRSLESRLHSLVGLSGSCFAVRKSVCEEWRTDIPSDFNVLLNARKLGMRGVLAKDILCTYQVVRTAEEEFERKVRTVLRGISTLFARKEVLNPFRYGIFTFQIVSHKLLRWLVPWFFILGSLGSLWLAAFSNFFLFLSGGIAGYIFITLLAYDYPRYQKTFLMKIPLFLFLSNAACLVAMVRYLRGKRAVTWSPSER